MSHNINALLVDSIAMKAVVDYGSISSPHDSFIAALCTWVAHVWSNLWTEYSESKVKHYIVKTFL